MVETKFKALMYCGQYVDVNRLEKGIYVCNKPFIYSKDDTIDTLIERGKQYKDMVGTVMLSETYFQNLKQCELVVIFITPSYI